MVPLSNEGGLSDESPSRYPSEVGYDSSSGVPPKFKSRRVSCVRDFPAGCGPNAPRINMKPGIEVELVGDKESLVADQMMADIVVADCDRTSEVGAEFQPRESPVQLEMPGLLDDLVGKVMTTVGMADGDDKLPANVEPFACGSPKSLEHIAPKLSRESNEVEVEALLKGVAVPESKTVLENDSLVDGVNPQHTKVCSPPEWPITGADVAEETVLKNKYPHKRVSARRDFPPFCGRNAPCPTKEERCGIFLNGKTLSAKKAGMEGRLLTDTLGTVVEDGSLREVMGASVEKSERDVQGGNTQKKESKGVTPEPGDKSKLVSKKSNSTVRGSGEKVGQELTVYSHEVSLKRRRDPVNLGCQVDRVIVQGLMAAPNCPWRQGRGARKIKSDGVIIGSKTKKHDLTGQDKPKFTTLTNNSEEDHFAEKSVNDDSVSAEKEAHENICALTVRDEDDSSVHDEEQHRDSSAGERPRGFDVSLPPFGPNSSSHGDSRNKVRETLRLFQAICRKLLQGEEAKLRQGEDARSKQRGNLRIDLLAAKIIRDKGKEVNTAKQILGAVPGVEVGDEFQYRVELALIGVHRLYQAGIDYIKHGGVAIASSIVASGGYADDLDSADVLIYSGQGGIGHDKKPEDQKLERGNLALKNSISTKNPVRVIRGFKETKASNSDARAKMVATYTYDGLYMVERYWQEPGPYGKLVFKFELRRISGQKDLAWKEVKKSKKYKMREGLCVDDVSSGKELFPICAVNTIDNEKPPPFTYITKIIYPDWYHPIPLVGCDCTDGCSDSKKCSCVVLNGGEIPYNHNGAIVEVKPLVYECGPSCRCPPSCYNRVTQHGIKIQLEIFKTESRGWGVRSLTSIPSGSFICEYVGELLEDKEAERRTGNDEYLFDIGQNYNDWSISDVPHSVQPDALAISSEVVEDGGYTIDAAQYGNLGRFINHSCSPNLYAQNVLYDHDDKRMPHIMLFAAENIPPLQELTYHYNYSIDQIRDSNGNIKMKSCYCGAADCTGRMY